MLENAWNQEGEQAMNQAPAPVAPIAQPGAKVSFDVNQNPQDMQFMTDAMAYVPMLQAMDDDRRKEKWPQMVQSLQQVSPKASALFDPSLPPSNKDLEMLMSNMQPANEDKGQENVQLASARDDYNQAMVKRQLEGKAPVSQQQWEVEKAQQDKQKQEEDAKTKQAQDGQRYTGLADNEFIRRAMQDINSLTGGNSSNPLSQDPNAVSKGFADVKSAVSGAFDAAGNAIVPNAQAFSLNMKDPRYENAPDGYRWTDSTQTVLEEIPGGPKDRNVVAAQQKAKSDNQKVQTPGYAAMAKVAQASLPAIQKLLFKDDGSVNWTNVYQRPLTNVPFAARAFELGKAKELSQAYELAIQAATRAETQAAMPPAEVDNARKRYQCDSTDTEDSCIRKYLSLKLFTNQYVSLVGVKNDGNKQTAYFDDAKAAAADTYLQVIIQNKKQDWVDRAMALPGNANKTPEDLQKAFNLKMLNDPNFVKQVGEEMKAELEAKKGKSE